MIIRPPAVEPVSQLQLRVCRRCLRASLGQEVQLDRYFPLGRKLQSPGAFSVWRMGLDLTSTTGPN